MEKSNFPEMSFSQGKSLDHIRTIMNSCIQCGTCTASCPNSPGMDYPPRRMWRYLQTGDYKSIFESKSFVLCSSCYMCRIRCPRGLPLTECIGELKRIAAAMNTKVNKNSTIFYNAFMESVRKHGRVDEMELMTTYFLGLKNPSIPLKFTPLGLKLLMKKKVSFYLYREKKAVLDAIFKKVRELEAES